MLSVLLLPRLGFDMSVSGLQSIQTLHLYFQAGQIP